MRATVKVVRNGDTFKFKNNGYFCWYEYLEATYIRLKKILTYRCGKYGKQFVDSTFRANYRVDGEEIPFLHSVGGVCVDPDADLPDYISKYYCDHVLSELHDGLKEFFKYKNSELISIDVLEVGIHDMEDCWLYEQAKDFGESFI